MENQDTIDKIYDEFLQILHNGMDSELEYKDYSGRTKQRRRKHKPYWDDELKQLWLYAREAEKLYLRYDGGDICKGDVLKLSLSIGEMSLTGNYGGQRDGTMLVTGQHTAAEDGQPQGIVEGNK